MYAVRLLQLSILSPYRARRECSRLPARTTAVPTLGAMSALRYIEFISGAVANFTTYTRF